MLIKFLFITIFGFLLINEINSLKCDEHQLSEICTITDMNLVTKYAFSLHDNTQNNLIKTLNFKNSKTFHFPAGIFDQCRNLNTIDISNCSISVIGRFTFTGAKNLTKINLSFNKIVTIEDNTFIPGAENLEIINLNNNNISLINDNGFNKLTQLKYLYLANNKLKRLTAEMMITLPNIQSLILAGNELEVIEDVFTYNQNLIVFDISENNLIILEVKHHFKSINITNNNLTRPKLISDTIYANNNKIKTMKIGKSIDFEASNNRLTNIISDDPEQVTTLILSNNSLTDLNFLIKMKNLILLDLSYNKIQLNLTTFYLLEELMILKMRACGLTSLQLNTFSHQKNLTYLDLSYNNFYEIDLNIFQMNNLIEELYIDGNNLTQLSIEKFHVVLPNIKIFGLTNNNWKCTFLALLLANFHNINFHIGNSKNSSKEINGTFCINSINDTNIDVKSLLNVNELNIELYQIKLKTNQLQKDVNFLKDEIYQLKQDTIKKTTTELTPNIIIKTTPKDNNHLKSITIILSILLVICGIFVVVLYYFNKRKILLRPRRTTESTISLVGDEGV